MTDAEKAYAAAEAEIERVRQSGETKLDFDKELFRELVKIPPAISSLSEIKIIELWGTFISDLRPINGLVGLKELGVSNTQVSELGPLTGLNELKVLLLSNTPVSSIEPLRQLTKLSELWLDGTQVYDLRPLATLQSLKRKSVLFDGLSFKEIPATQIDPRLREISEIENNSERSFLALNYLAALTEWPPRRDPPEQEAALRVGATAAGLDVAAGEPTVEEAADRVRRACLERLRPAAENLARAAGNIHGRLADRARALHGRLKGEVADLDLLEVHLDIEGLREIYDRRDERTGEDVLSADEVDALSDIARHGPGLVRGNEDVETLIDRARDGAPDVAEAREEAAKELATSLWGAESFVSPHMRAFIDRALHGNGPWRIARWFVVANATIFSTTLIAGGHEVIGAAMLERTLPTIEWVLGNWRAITVVIGEQYATWLAMVHEAALQWLRNNGHRDLALKYLREKD